MAVRIGTVTEGIEIECLHVETNPHVLGDLRHGVSVRTGDFAGSTEAYVLQPTWSAFLRELRELEKTRRGAATLEGVSPGELRLALRVTDRAGHMTIDGFVGVRGPYREVKLEFSPMEFDPGDLASIVRHLSAFAPAYTSS